MMNNKKTTYAIITILCVVLFSIWFVKEKNNQNFVVVNADAAETKGSTQQPIIDTTEKTKDEIEPTLIKIYISGEIRNPDVYEVELGTRIVDIIEIAGGVTDEADLENINLSKKVQDEQHIIIPKMGEEVDKSLDNLQNRGIDNNGSNKVNINTANKEELKTLVGIGDITAESIIEYREKNGYFNNIEELKNVNRIGNKTFDKLKDNITID